MVLKKVTDAVSSKMAFFPPQVCLDCMGWVARRGGEPAGRPTQYQLRACSRQQGRAARDPLPLRACRAACHLQAGAARRRRARNLRFANAKVRRGCCAVLCPALQPNVPVAGRTTHDAAVSVTDGAAAAACSCLLPNRPPPPPLSNPTQTAAGPSACRGQRCTRSPPKKKQ